MVRDVEPQLRVILYLSLQRMYVPQCLHRTSYKQLSRIYSASSDSLPIPMVHGA